MKTKKREKTYRCRSFRVALRLATGRFAPRLRILYDSTTEYPMARIKMKYRAIFVKQLYFREILSQYNSPLKEQEEGRVVYANSFLAKLANFN